MFFEKVALGKVGAAAAGSKLLMGLPPLPRPKKKQQQEAQNSSWGSTPPNQRCSSRGCPGGVYTPPLLSIFPVWQLLSYPKTMGWGGGLCIGVG